MPKKDDQVTSYRTFFVNDSGKRVLAELLTDAGLFDTDLSTPEEIAVENYAKKILHKMGICNTPESIMEYIQKLSEMKGF